MLLTRIVQLQRHIFRQANISLEIATRIAGFGESRWPIYIGPEEGECR